MATLVRHDEALQAPACVFAGVTARSSFREGPSRHVLEPHVTHDQDSPRHMRVARAWHPLRRSTLHRRPYAGAMAHAARCTSLLSLSLTITLRHARSQPDARLIFGDCATHFAALILFGKKSDRCDVCLRHPDGHRGGKGIHSGFPPPCVM